MIVVLVEAGVTSLAAWAKAGDTKLEVPSIIGFTIGARIQIGNEFNVIKASWAILMVVRVNVMVMFRIS